MGASKELQELKSMVDRMDQEYDKLSEERTILFARAITELALAFERSEHGNLYRESEE